MLSICGLDCCNECNKKNDCDGCVKTDGHPFGGTCVAAECVRREGLEGLKKMKEMLIEEFHALGIQSLQVKDLNLLNGFFVNLEYTLANGQSVKLLEDDRVYWGSQKFQLMGMAKKRSNPLGAKNSDSPSEKWAIESVAIPIKKTIAAHAWVHLSF